MSTCTICREPTEQAVRCPSCEADDLEWQARARLEQAQQLEDVGQAVVLDEAYTLALKAYQLCPCSERTKLKNYILKIAQEKAREAGVDSRG